MSRRRIGATGARLRAPMRDLFDDFMDELRRRQEVASGRTPPPDEDEPDPDDDPSDDDARGRAARSAGPRRRHDRRFRGRRPSAGPRTDTHRRAPPAIGTPGPPPGSTGRRRSPSAPTRRWAGGWRRRAPRDGAAHRPARRHRDHRDRRRARRHDRRLRHGRDLVPQRQLRERLLDPGRHAGRAVRRDVRRQPDPAPRRPVPGRPVRPPRDGHRERRHRHVLRAPGRGGP